MEKEVHFHVCSLKDPFKKLANCFDKMHIKFCFHINFGIKSKIYSPFKITLEFAHNSITSSILRFYDNSATHCQFYFSLSVFYTKKKVFTEFAALLYGCSPEVMLRYKQILHCIIIHECGAYVYSGGVSLK